MKIGKEIVKWLTLVGSGVNYLFTGGQESSKKSLDAQWQSKDPVGVPLAESMQWSMMESYSEQKRSKDLSLELSGGNEMEPTITENKVHTTSKKFAVGDDKDSSAIDITVTKNELKDAYELTIYLKRTSAFSSYYGVSLDHEKLIALKEILNAEIK